MKISTTVFITSMITGTLSFQPAIIRSPRNPGVASLCQQQSNDQENVFEKAADAISNAANAVQDTVEGAVENAGPDAAPGTPTNLSREEEKEMWEAQRELQANRNKHSSKESRHEKYADEPVVDNDKHGELNKPWTKSDEADDHYSVNRKL